MDTNQFFIVIEGIDGCGKSTQLDLLAQYFSAFQRQPVRVNDPGSSPLALALRELLLHKVEVQIEPKQQALLFTAARSDVASHIAMLLVSGSDVLCDRWFMSTMTYQGVMGGVSSRALAEMHDYFVGLDPDIYILLDVPVEEAAQRRKHRDVPDRFESKPLEWQEGLAKAYKMAAISVGAHVIDGTGMASQVFSRVLDACKTSEKFRKAFT